MNLKAVSIFLLLLLGNMLVMTFSAMQGRAEEIVYIRTDGTVYPTAPIQRDGDIYTLISDISKAIVVQRDNIVIDGKGFVLQGDGTSRGIDLSNRKNVTIKRWHITGFGYGIYLSQSNNNKIINNTITNCVYGIISDRSPSNTMSNNFVVENSWDGIFMTYSDGSILSDNFVANHSKWGLYLGSSTGIVLRTNNIIGNRWNFGVSNMYVHDIDTSNTVDWKPIYYFVNQHDKHVPSDAGYVAVIDSANISVTNLNLTNNGQGVVLVNSKKCLVANSLITRMGYYAIQLVNSNNNTITNNNIRDNIPPYFGVGIAIQRQSTDNTISKNTLQNNRIGVLFHNSGGNKICHNNFLENTIQASSENSKNNWDDGYPSGGNYWIYHWRTDLFGGPYQNVTGSDGIVDTPRTIDANNQDNYPLINPWTPTFPTVTTTINIYPETLNLKSRGKWITVHIELSRDHSVSEINRTTILLNGTISVDPFWRNKPFESAVGDYDDDNIPDLMVKFDRNVVSDFILLEDTEKQNLTLTISGKLFDGTLFEGSDAIQVTNPCEVNYDNELADIYSYLISEFP